MTALLKFFKQCLILNHMSDLTETWWHHQDSEFLNSFHSDIKDGRLKILQRTSPPEPYTVLNLCKNTTLKKSENWEHSAIPSTFIKPPFFIKIFVLSIFEWPFYTGFTVCQKLKGNLVGFHSNLCNKFLTTYHCIFLFT